MKRLFKAGIFILFLSKIVFSQIPEITQFTAQDTTVSHLYSSIIELDNGDLFMIWIESGHLKISNSYDGINWAVSRVLLSDLSEDLSSQDLATYKTKSGKVLIAYRSSAEITEYHIISSTDNGMNWSLPALLIKDLTDNANKKWDIKFSQTDDNKLWFTFVINSDIECITSKDDGVTWSNKKILTTYSKYGNVISVGDSLMLIFERDYNILSRTSSDSGNTWGTIDTIFNENKYNYEPSVVKKSDGSLMLIFRTSNFSALGDYYFIESVDDGKTWSSSTQFTKYSGIDSKLRINTNSENMFACFVSARSFNETDFEKRSRSYTIWYGIVGVSDDIYTPPVINEITHSPDFPNSQDTIIFNAEVFDDEYVTHVFLKYKLNDIEQTPIEMFDDGLHYDGQPDDSVYGIIIDSLSIHDQLVYSIAAEDNKSNNSERFGDSIYIDIPYTYRSYLIDINRFKLPLDNQGVLADVKENGQYSYGGRFDSLSVLYSGGFALSGYKAGGLWGNEMFTTSRITDYLPGIVGGDKDDANNKVYILKSSDEPFGPSWQVWKYAVSLGAKFYDGDGDGVYNPIDINGNGIWDENEDHPDLIGDVTAWTVFNDGVPEDLRSYQVSPKDIEIKQTVFGYASKTHEELDGILFVRYNIENKSTKIYDSVYFSVMADPDIGDYANDLTGCDTTVNS
ncbi:MAG: exo-alpha-sialidase, partial [Chlorobi bacterium]|nr:exo-alpha-sialidase [Chlorobiota bacterium]